ncbi:MAG: peptidylprolyl isomerase [Alphaproteobacteria bacterium]|nr:peptidylprolyl isomerase [Alphaproteobacteria bacterium]
MRKFVASLLLSAVTLALAVQGSALGDALEGEASSADILEASDASDWLQLDQDNLLYIELERGRVIVALSTSLAQGHVAQIKALTREHFYDGLSFYRVIDGFVAQGGDVLEAREIKTAKKTMTAEFDELAPDWLSFKPLADEDGYAAITGFVNGLPVGLDESASRAWHLHCAGAFAFGRNNDRDSASTEFYITLQPQRYLDRNLTVFGRVVAGMEHLQALRRVQPAETPEDDLGETLISMRIGADMPEADRAALEILRSDTPTFQQYVASRRNRPEEFFYFRPDYINVCDLPYPVREISDTGQ